MTTNNTRKQKPATKAQAQPHRTAWVERAPQVKNTSLQEGLAVLMQQSLQHASPAERAPAARSVLGYVPSSDQDGITHINFGPAARTDLGRLLSFSNTLAFGHPTLDVVIPTMQHFWVFLQDGARNKAIFNFDANALRLKNIHNGHGKYVPHQFALLAQAYWFKFLEHELLGNVFAKSKDALDYYLNDETRNRRPLSAALLVDILSAARNAWRNDQHLDLVPFVDQDLQLELRNTDVAVANGIVADKLAQILTERVSAFEADAAARKPKPQKQPKAAPAPKAEKAQALAPVSEEKAAELIGTTGADADSFPPVGGVLTSPAAAAFTSDVLALGSVLDEAKVDSSTPSESPTESLSADQVDLAVIYPIGLDQTLVQADDSGLLPIGELPISESRAVSIDGQNVRDVVTLLPNITLGGTVVNETEGKVVVFPGFSQQPSVVTP